MLWDLLTYSIPTGIQPEDIKKNVEKNLFKIWSLLASTIWKLLHPPPVIIVFKYAKTVIT